MTSFDLLSEPIKKYIFRKGWEELRAIQNAAIPKILSTDANYILASRTASGKTEAAFLPILSKVNFNEPGIQVLYISPLIALINDQFHRIEELCKDLEILVTKWHGEANRTLKEKLIGNPNGIVLITPESIEAMFVNKSFNVKLLFSNLKYIVIDEIHSFIGTDRGVQLKSLLFRFKQINEKQFITIGISATIGDFNEAKKFTGDELNTKVLLDKTQKSVDVLFRYFSQEKAELSSTLLSDLYFETKDKKVLIFPNSRGHAEEVAVKLMQHAEKFGGHQNYFSHHSSVDREVREYVEYFAKNNNRQNFCISCTSTLELGIDIGSVDEVVQIDATHSISSLVQRVGRSGRKDGEVSRLLLYSTNKWSLLQSIACWLLYKENFVEPPSVSKMPYDILLHQALSITKGSSGILLSDLIKQLKENFAFDSIEVVDIVEIINHLIEIDLLEILHKEVIIGFEGEKIVNSKDFYSVFRNEENLKVVNAGRKIGEVPLSPQIELNENIFLAAKIWKIVNIDFASKKIEVISAFDGKVPHFFGNGGNIHPRIREKIAELLFSQDEFDFLDEASANELRCFRNEFTCFNIKNFFVERPLLVTLKDIRLFTFTGTRINHTIQYLLKLSNIENTLDDNQSIISIKIKLNDFLQKLEKLREHFLNLDEHILNLIREKPGILDFSKWGNLLPEKFQIQILKDKYFDIENAELFLRDLITVQNSEFQVYK